MDSCEAVETPAVVEVDLSTEKGLRQKIACLEDDLDRAREIHEEIGNAMSLAYRDRVYEELHALRRRLADMLLGL